MEFDTAVRHGLNIVAIIGNDSAWGIDRQIQIGLYGRAVATDLRQSRYEQVVQGLGGHGEFVERPDDLKPALERALAAGKPALNVAGARDQPESQRHRPAQSSCAEVSEE
jgi:acetolactate synthase-1/2/3 large subunit